MAATKPPTRFFVIIPRDIRDRLVPKRSEAFGLYAQLADAVTCNVPHGAEKFGLVFGGALKSQDDWAKRFRMSERSFQRALAALKTEKLVVVHRGQHASRMAITDSVKKVKRRGSIQNFPWVLGHSDPPETAELDSRSDPPELAELSAKTADLAAKTADLGESKNAQPIEDAMTYGEQNGWEERTEERIEEIPNKPAKTALSTSLKSTSNPTPNSNLAEVCAKLYTIGKSKNPCQPTFSGKYRIEMCRLLATYSADELCEAYGEFVQDLDDFQMRNAPKHFAEGGAVDVITDIRERKRLAEEKSRVRDGLLAKWRQRQVNRHRTRVEDEVLEEQESRCGTEEPASSSLYQRHQLARKITGSYNYEHLDEREALKHLRTEAAVAPEIQNAVEERLTAEPFDPGPCPHSDFELEFEFGKPGELTRLDPAPRPQLGGKPKLHTFDALTAFRAQK